MLYVYLWLKAWMSEEEGQDLIEYVLIAGFIAIVAVTAIQLSGTAINNVWEFIQTQLESIPTA